MPFTYAIGNKVRIIGASYGWGDSGVVPDDIGTIVAVQQDNVTLNIVGKTEVWFCKIEDIEPADMVQEAHSQVTKFHSRMREKLEELRDMYSRNMSDTLYLRTQNRIENMCPQDTELYERIKETVVSKILFKGERMYVTTKPITLTYKPKNMPMCKVDMGFYDIVINFNSHAITMTQQVPEKFLHHYDHPHISNHIPCLGSYHEPLRNATMTFDVCKAIVICLDYLSSCNTQGWYCPIMEWLPEDMKRVYESMCFHCECDQDECECDRCSHCGNMTDDCECTYCEHCDAYDDNCECLKCPDNYERLENNSFPDSSCISCSSLCKNFGSGEWECLYNGTDDPYYTSDLESFTVNEPNSRARYRTIDEDGVEHRHPNERTR